MLISPETVDLARKIATDATDVAQAFAAGVDEARDAYFAKRDSTKTWRAYTHAMDQLAVANARAGAAAELSRAVAKAYHLEAAWHRLQSMPLALQAVPKGYDQLDEHHPAALLLAEDVQ